VQLDTYHIIQYLTEEGLIDSQFAINIIPMEGGVSSDIHLIENGSQKFVVKTALDQLKVKDVWEADTSRNFAEQAFIEYVGAFLSENVPRLIYCDRVNPYFIMEYLAPPLVNWKTTLLTGHFDLFDATRVVDLLVKIHNRAKGDSLASQLFAYSDNFFSLRIEPYLITTGERNPELQSIFWTEADRLKNHHETLVHGDFSPKNILLSEERVVILDHEVANYGDPSFDLAFLINHLILKKIHLIAKDLHPLPDLAPMVFSRYFDQIEIADKTSLKTRTSRLVLMLMLARIDGKSPVDYLDENQKGLVRDFVYKLLPSPDSSDFEAYYPLLFQPIFE